MRVSVYSCEGKETGRFVDLPSNVFCVDFRQQVVYLAVKNFLANQRQGTHKTKERSEVSLSTRKLYRQKGTGGARAGSAKSPLRKSGGTIFGPRPRTYGFKLNKKENRLARISLLSEKARSGALRVVEHLKLESPATKAYQFFLNAFGLEGKRTLMITPAVDPVLVLSSRNIQKTKIVPVEGLNAYEVAQAQFLLISEHSLPLFAEKYTRL